MTRQTAIQTTSPHEISIKSAPVPQAQNVAENSWSYLPSIDIVEWPDKYTITCDAPGIIAEQISLTYVNGVLNLHGPVQQRYSTGVKFLRQEYGVGHFDRTIPLGRLAEFIDGDAISASYEQGVLTVQLPKIAKVLGRKITVKSN